MEWCVKTLAEKCVCELKSLLGDATYAAITAILVANAILIVYIITSLLEDQRETDTVKEDAGVSKKEQ
jgi:hypothetical protein